MIRRHISPVEAGLVEWVLYDTDDYVLLSATEIAEVFASSDRRPPDSGCSVCGGTGWGFACLEDGHRVFIPPNAVNTKKTCMGPHPFSDGAPHDARLVRHFPCPACVLVVPEGRSAAVRRGALSSLDGGRLVRRPEGRSACVPKLPR